MDPTVIWNMVFGPLGALVILALAVIFLVRGQYIAPKYLLDAEQQKVALLESENKKLHNSVLDLKLQQAHRDGEMRNLEGEVKSLRVEIKRLRKDVNGQ